MLIDSHCHLHLLDYPALGETLDQVMIRAEQEGVQHFLCVGTTLADQPALLAIAEQYPAVSLSVGLHPNEKVEREPTVQELISLAEHPKVIAIGETGLDYFRTEDSHSGQIDRFVAHITAAKACRKPLIIHTRQARKDTIEVLQRERASDVRGVLHCFTEDWETAKEAMDLDFYISFSGIITFKNATELQAVAKKVPLDRILIETDAPYLAPVPYRGKINQPAYVKMVAAELAKLKGLSFEEVASQTTRNFYSLFLPDHS